MAPRPELPLGQKGKRMPLVAAGHDTSTWVGFWSYYGGGGQKAI
jgi:hypothetical protein